MIYNINNLRLRAIIGPYEWERDIKQNLVLNVTYEMDAAKGEQSDEIGDVLNYHTLVNEIVERVEGSRFNLVEKLVDYVIGTVLSHKKIQWVEVEIHKPDALRFADSISLKTKRGR